ncbi:MULTISPECIES: DUF6279 family lipoprotein [Vibrio]|uniref:DUF6279 family lipoprotein n=1 Tax=Vibrio TaxID=662 RepID=UPI00207519DF|nr:MULTISPECIES: DUF6279 family lipoprotein [Vibrio]USD35095.1 hypothetical protein J8Z27_17505 [Vibrio sp. SCSIO 43186]USD48161.1 hypothetical protein J4N38_17895 [Vibrio sp. SCSIO 43145]USD72220.1 hypothetical protein J4N41_17515 [Vibrio sp. SCSIO 43139]USD97894.1 hypothetical protein CTT30_17715 [Vibrio coralliilyticus]
MKQWGLLIAICFALTGCSTKFIYNNMDWLLVEYLEDFVELNDEQEELVSEKIELLSDWHRREEIPNYIEHLDQLIALDPKSFTEEDLKTQEKLFQEHTKRLVGQIAPEVFALARELSDEQAEELMDNIRVRHTRYKKKYQTLSEDEIRANYQDKITENFDDWLGSLTSEQEHMIEEWADQLVVTSYDWIDHQTKMRIEMNTLLTNRMQTGYFQPHFQQLMFNPASFYSAELEEKIDYNKAIADKYLVKIINSVTNRQTAHYRQELRDWRNIAMDIQ